MLIDLQTNERVSEISLRQNHPNVSFPSVITDEVARPFGFAVLNYPETPATGNDKKVIDAGVEFVNGGWSVKYELVALNEQEASAYAQSVRDRRTLLLAQSDWTQVADAPVDRAAWAAYRQALRDISAQPGFPLSVSWPAEPGA